MSKLKPWVKPLKVSIKDYELWSAEVSSEESVTYWALNKGKLRADKYLYWAREHYQLPVLKDSYFSNHCNHTLWQQIQSVANWSPQLFPVDEWDGVIYLACVEPPNDASWSFPVAYILASARTMKAHWKKLNDGPPISIDSQSQTKEKSTPSVEDDSDVAVTSLSQAPTEEPTIPPVPDSLDVPNFEFTDVGDDHIASIQIPEAEDEAPTLGEFVSADQVSVVANSDTDTPIVNEVVSGDETVDCTSDENIKITNDFQLEIPPVPESIEFSLEETTQEKMDTPEGMSLDLPLEEDHAASPEGFALDLPLTDEDISAPEGMGFEAPAEDGTPDGMGTDDPLTKDEFTLNPPKTLTSMNVLSDLAPPQTDVPPEVPSDKTLAPKNKPTASEDTTLNTDTKKNVEFKLKFDISDGKAEDTPPEPTQLTNTTHTNNGTVTRFAITTTGVNKEAPSGAVVNTDKSAPHTSDSCTSEAEVAAWLFSELRSHFHQSMILLYNGKELKPWKWENNWAPASTQAFEGFNPDQPGLFRIIKRTKQPYHGYIVKSSLNKEFFKLWGFESFPEHVTAMPLVIDGHLSGIVLSLSDESSNTDRVLMDTEKIVDEFLTALIRITSKAA